MVSNERALAVKERIAAVYDLDKVYTEERALLQDVKDILKLFKFYFIRTESDIRSGYPDIVVCCNGMFIGIELKDNEGKLSKQQEKHIVDIKSSGGRAAGCRTLREVLDLIFA